MSLRAQELCESRCGRPGLSSQIVLMASVDGVKQHLKKQTLVAPLSKLRTELLIQVTIAVV